MKILSRRKVERSFRHKELEVIFSWYDLALKAITLYKIHHKDYYILFLIARGQYWRVSSSEVSDLLLKSTTDTYNPCPSYPDAQQFPVYELIPQSSLKLVPAQVIAQVIASELVQD